jgi:uncharacterized protein YqeY
LSLQAKIDQDLKEAMRNKDKIRMSAIRMLKAAIKKQEIEKRGSLTDEEIVDVISREIKQRRDSISEYEKAGRQDLVDKEQAEVDILMTYLPKQLTEEEIRSLVQQVIAEVGAKSKADMGKVMSAIMPKVKGRADGRVVNQIAQQLLG